MIVPATRDHVEALYPEFSFSMRGYSIVIDNEVLAVAGIYKCQGNNIAFVNVTDKAREKKKQLIQLARKVIPLMSGKRVYACRDSKISTSESLLKHFGFKHLENNIWIR